MTPLIARMMMLQAAPACPAAPPFAGWERPAPAISDNGGARLTVGRATVVTLTPDPRFAVAPGKPVPSGGLGGTATFVALTAGHYRVGLDAGVWIDLIEQGHALPSTAHAHGRIAARSARSSIST